MAKSLEVVRVMVVLTLLLAGAAAASADTFILRTGEHITGELQEAELLLKTPDATLRVTRVNARKVDLCYCGDHVLLRNGNQVSGLLDQGRYALKLPNGQTRILDRGEVNSFTLAAPDPAARGATDVIVLANGDHVYGEVAEAEFDLLVPTGTVRFKRNDLSRIVLATAVGDSLDLANGDRMSGIVDLPRYSIRTPDGQTLTFGRHQVGVVTLRPPALAAAPAPAPVPAPAVAAPPAPAPAPAAPPPAPVPAPVPAPAPAPAPAAPPPAAAVPPAAIPAPLRTALRDIYFEFDRWEITAEARPTLEQLATALKAFPSLALRVEGHADERGTTEYNLALAARRAQAARDYLVSLGIDPARLETVSFGEERPFDPGKTEQAWTLNRRVHFGVKSR
jgi:peptidoglycan-associated lipoprotein